MAGPGPFRLHRRVGASASKPREQFPGLSLCVLAYRAINFLRGVQKTSAGQSTPFVRQAPANRPPLLQMLFLWTGLLLSPRSAWPRPLSVGRRPHAMTYKANARSTKPFLPAPVSLVSIAIVIAPPQIQTLPSRGLWPWRQLSFSAQTPGIGSKDGSRTMGPGTARPISRSPA
jgi:hypothetical protein